MILYIGVEMGDSS